MTGYEVIKNMPVEQLAKKIGTSKIFAAALKAADKEEIPQVDFCPDNLGWPRPCIDKTYSCVQCRKEFLENEISMP